MKGPTMDRSDVTEISKIIAVETAKGYAQALAVNVAALGLLAGIGLIWMKVDEFRKSHKKF
ncbi:MAG: hypothetical protein ACJ74Y_14225 [Bryobacteraceae bacterium]